MENIKLNGYYVDIGLGDYNTWGKVNQVWNTIGAGVYIDLDKEVGWNGHIFVDTNEFCAKIKADENYKPIGKRVGEMGKKFNAIVFTSFSFGKGSFYDNFQKEMKQNGIVLPGKYGISILGDDEENSKLKDYSGFFFNNMIEIKSKLKQSNSISIADIDSLNCIGFPGIEDFESFQENPEEFLDSFCVDSNEDYLSFKKFILVMHHIFNILNWTFQNERIKYPALILLIAKVYNEINNERADGDEGKYEYFLSFGCDLNGFEKTLMDTWFDKCDGLWSQDQFQKPSSVIAMAMNFNENLFDISFSNDTLFEDIVNSPVSSNENTSHTSLDFCKSIFQLDSIDSIKNNIIISTWINHTEPNKVHKSNDPIKHQVNESFVKNISDIALSNNYKGILLLADRIKFHQILENIQPARVSFDDSISDFYNEENSNKISEYLSNQK